MSKVESDIVKSCMTRREIDANTAEAVLADALKEQELINAEKDTKPHEKKQYVILVSDPEGVLEGKELVGWVLQIDEESSPLQAEERVRRAAYDYNASLKGRRFPTYKVGEAIEVVPSRFGVAHKVWFKTKEPVLVVTTDNEIPREPVVAD